MVGNDPNLDILQLVSRLSGTTEVSNILAKYPHWDHAPQRLKLPAMTRESEAIPERADHIKPASWRGNVNVKDVSLQTSWNCGRLLAEWDCDFLGSILSELDKDENANILAPSGTILFNVPLADDDINESLKFPSPPPGISESDHLAESSETRVEVEDALGELCLADAAAISKLDHWIWGSHQWKNEIKGVSPGRPMASTENVPALQIVCSVYKILSAMFKTKRSVPVLL